MRVLGIRMNLVAVVIAVLAAVGLVAAMLVPGAGSAQAQPGPSSPDNASRRIGHVWTIILENKSFEATFTGLNQNDYLWKTLPASGLLMRQYYGTGHFSLDNYQALIGGQSPAPDNQADCPQYKDLTPGTPAPDGQVHAPAGCVYPSSIPTLFNQFDRARVPWKVYAQDMGNDPGREDPYRCGIPGNPAGNGVPDPGGATATDQYVAKHNPAAWFHTLIDNQADCDRVTSLAGLPAAKGHPAKPGLEQDLKREETTPRFSWITPNNCSDAHDATCKGDNLSGDPANHQGGLFAADVFLKKYVPEIMASPAFQHDGLIQVIFDEAFPPYKIYGNSIADYTGDPNPALDVPTDTAQSVVACCGEIPGPNTDQPGDKAFGQDTTPGGGITGAVFISRYITPGSVTDQPYNHYSWLRSTEDLFDVNNGGADNRGHLGYAAEDGLRDFGPDVFNNPSGRALPPAPSGSTLVFPATASANDRVQPVTPAK